MSFSGYCWANFDAHYCHVEVDGVKHDFKCNNFEEAEFILAKWRRQFDTEPTQAQKPSLNDVS